ncbi:unnamed protein product [Rodentolepis nana]|uniref:Uncharacterized protein n=1 Tax=Rodentolepis nana TaxID=102285 RepID=A0A3P7TKE4_RODNA|nr:unnamed protein product [Rodentolepis nana]
MADVSNQYVQVKKERNNLVGLLQSAVQTASLTRERLQQQANESEILLTATQKSDVALAAIRSELTKISSQRDNKRRELCKAAEYLAADNDQKEEMKFNLKSFELVLNRLELSNKSLEKVCERHSEMRKERVVCMIERNRDILILKVSKSSCEANHFGSGFETIQTHRLDVLGYYFHHNFPSYQSCLFFRSGLHLLIS